MASVLKVDKLDPQSGTALEIGTSGDTISVPSGATLDISASTLTPPATMPASSGINFTALNATNLGSGTVPTARLGTGTASSSTVLYGDQTYKAEPGGGKINQVVWVEDGTYASSTSSVMASANLSTSLTPSASDSKILILMDVKGMKASGNTGIQTQISGKVGAAAESVLRQFTGEAGGTDETTRNGGYSNYMSYLWSPSSTDECIVSTGFARYGASGEVRTNGVGNTYSSLVLMEVLA